MGDVVSWRETQVADQVLGRVGNADLFVVVKNPDSGQFLLGSRDPFSDGELIAWAHTPFPDAAGAQRAAEERIARMLALLDLTPHAAA